MMLRFLCLATSVITFFTMFGCGSVDTDESSEGDVSQAQAQSQTGSDAQSGSAKDILSQINDDNLTASAYYGDDTYTKNAEKLYGIAADDIADGGIIYAADGGLADEVSIIKLADGSSAQSALSSRVDYRLNQFENYKPEETKKIEAAQIFHAGDYWVLVISDNAQDISDKIKTLAGE